MWGSLIGAGASLLSGLFGGGSKKQQTTTTNYVDYGRMVRDAEAAGFNPLTALRNGGAAGFSVSTGTTSATPLSARIADGVAGATNSFLANFDPFKDQQREMGFKLMEAQVANLNADTSLKKIRFGDVPSTTGGNIKRTLGAGVKHGQTFKSVADVLPASAGASQTPTVEKPTVTNPFPTKWGLTVNPEFPDAEAYETRYGDNEVGPNVLGNWGTFFADVYANNKKFADHMYKNYSPFSPDARSRYSRENKRRLSENYHPAGTNIYGLPAGQMPSLSSPRKYKQ